MPQKLVCTPNEPDMLMTVFIELESPGSSKILQVRLECMHWHTDDMHCPRSGADASDGHIDRSRGSMDDSRGWTDALNMSSKPETANMSCGDSSSMYLGAEDMKCGTNMTDGVGSHATDTSTWSMDIPSIQTDTIMPTNALQKVSMHLIRD